MKFSFWLFLFSGFIYAECFAQTTISGRVQDMSGESLSGATVTVSIDSTAAISAFDISGSGGDFQLKINSKADSLYLKISFVGFSSWSKKIKNVDQNLEVTLQESFEELKEVVVEARIIHQRGDTLSFQVSAFQDQKDRVIADVLKKMPGIDVMPNGQILYQGQPIQKFYIEGLDLLEGRYSLANNNLAANDVSEVQILENHQPVKVLDSLEFSERASLNIKLKKDVTISGTARIGGGLAPVLWNVNLTPMIFTKKQQAIVTYQANNTGSDVSREIRDFSFSDLGREEFSISKKDWLDIRTLSPPPFEKERWLENNVHLGSANYLVRLKNELDLKLNISYLYDFQQQVGEARTSFYTPTDTIDLAETTRNDLFTNTQQSKFVLERNSNERYLKNELEINRFWDSGTGKILSGNGILEQDLSNPFSAFRNKFHLLRPIGKQLVTFRSNTGYIEADQNLRVSPGQFADVLNEGEPYAESEQWVNSRTLFTDNSVGFTKGIGSFTISPEAGFTFKKEGLESRLGTSQAGKTFYPGENFQNELDFFQTRFYLTNKLVYHRNNWNIRLITPLNFRKFSIEDSFLEGDRVKKKLTFEPDLFIERKFSAYLEGSVSANFSNDFGDQGRMHAGFILSNYRNLLSYDSLLPESFRQSYSGRIAYSDPVGSLFANARYKYSLLQNNLLYSNLIGDNGSLRVKAFEQKNYFSSHSLGFSAGKFFNKINTSFKFGSSYTLSKGEQLLNSTLATINNENLSFNLSVDSEVTNWLSTSYKGNYSLIGTGLEDRGLNNIRSQQHLLDLSFFPADNQFFNIEAEYYFNDLSDQNRNTYFLNFGYQYTFEERKIDLAATWNNILSTREFVNIFNNKFSSVQSIYSLRPSQLLVSLKFTF